LLRGFFYHYCFLQCYVTSFPQDGSPTKGRHNIRKIIKDKDLSKSTKEADREERERRKRMEERQKIYNETFDLTAETQMTELPLDFDPKTKKIFVEVRPWDRCYDFYNIFTGKGVFDSKQS
jgi:hypothetical protein